MAYIQGSRPTDEEILQPSTQDKFVYTLTVHSILYLRSRLATRPVLITRLVRSFKYTVLLNLLVISRI